MIRTVFGRNTRRLAWSYAPVVGVCAQYNVIQLTQNRFVKTSANFNIVSRHRDHNPRNNDLGFTDNYTRKTTVNLGLLDNYLFVWL